MSTTLPVKSTDIQAGVTTTILNIVRYVGVVGFGIPLLVVLVMATQDGRAILLVPGIVILAALWYASIGMVVDVLRLLAKIERNTRD